MPLSSFVNNAMSSTNLPLPQFYARALRNLLPVLDGTLPPREDSTQAQLKSAIDDLYVVGRMLSSLGVFSDNERADELGDRELVFMTVGWVLGESETRMGFGGPDARKAALERSDTAFNAFLSVLHTYKVVPEDEGAERALPSDPARRRDAKIAAHRRSKELREKIRVSCPLSGADLVCAAGAAGRRVQPRRVRPRPPPFREDVKHLGERRGARHARHYSSASAVAG